MYVWGTRKRQRVGETTWKEEKEEQEQEAVGWMVLGKKERKTEVKLQEIKGVAGIKKQRSKRKEVKDRGSRSLKFCSEVWQDIIKYT